MSAVISNFPTTPVVARVTPGVCIGAAIVAGGVHHGFDIIAQVVPAASGSGGEVSALAAVGAAAPSPLPAPARLCRVIRTHHLVLR